MKKKATPDVKRLDLVIAPMMAPPPKAKSRTSKQAQPALRKYQKG